MKIIIFILIILLGFTIYADIWGKNKCSDMGGNWVNIHRGKHCVDNNSNLINIYK